MFLAWQQTSQHFSLLFYAATALHMSRSFFAGVQRDRKLSLIWTISSAVLLTPRLIQPLSKGEILRSRNLTSACLIRSDSALLNHQPLIRTRANKVRSTSQLGML